MNNKSYKYVLFDWDGCLAKTLDVLFLVEKKLLNNYGIKASDQTLIKSFGDWEFGKKLGVKDNDKFIKEFTLSFDESIKNVFLYENVIRLLEDFKNKDVKMAIVTTSKSMFIDPALDKYNLKKYFDCILTAEDVTKHKPDPEVVNKAVELLGAVKVQTLIIGDGPKDILAGKATGITTVSFYPKDNQRYYSENDIKSFGADFVINDLMELTKIVN